VAPLAPRPGHRLLRCLICRLDLAAKAGGLACRNRHSFDLAREGYVDRLGTGYDRRVLRVAATTRNTARTARSLLSLTTRCL
jgi:hypothetical protein